MGLLLSLHPSALARLALGPREEGKEAPPEEWQWRRSPPPLLLATDASDASFRQSRRNCYRGSLQARVEFLGTMPRKSMPKATLSDNGFAVVDFSGECCGGPALEKPADDGFAVNSRLTREQAAGRVG